MRIILWTLRGRGDHDSRTGNSLNGNGTSELSAKLTCRGDQRVRNANCRRGQVQRWFGGVRATACQVRSKAFQGSRELRVFDVPE